MTALTTAPAGYVSRVTTWTDEYGTWEREDFVPDPAASIGHARPESEARTLWAAPTFGPDSLAVVAFDDDGTDPYRGGMAYMFDLDGYSRADARATFAREVGAANDFWTVVLIVNGEAAEVRRGEG